AYSFDLDLIGSSWYLTNPVLSASTAVYESYPQILASLNTLGSLQQRVGNRYWYGPDSAASSHGQGEAVNDGYGSSDSNAIWARIERAHSHVEPDTSTTSSQYDVDNWKMQAGTDWLLKEDSAGRLIGGINGHYGTASADIYSAFGNGFIQTSGYGVGATLTWIGNSGLYVDAQAQLSRFDSDLISATLGTLVNGNDGSGHALSVEVGKRFEGAGLTYTPQAQLIYSSVDFDSFTTSSATVSPIDGDSLKVRIGISGEHQYDWTGEDGMHNHGRVHAIANLYHELLDGTAVNVSGAQLSTQLEGWSGEVGIGGSIS
ncbi:MAG: autotransporter outer membrane beta-barrel domain-containing protein, partial [Gammaproteobacteria bacterium]|nr:autotransporter outer membrane beta-barrel domain-containing protein [Gammaproteobacteria bacterium]